MFGLLVCLLLFSMACKSHNYKSPKARYPCWCLIGKDISGRVCSAGARICHFQVILLTRQEGWWPFLIMCLCPGSQQSLRQAIQLSQQSSAFWATFRPTKNDAHSKGFCRVFKNLGFQNQIFFFRFLFKNYSLCHLVLGEQCL